MSTSTEDPTDQSSSSTDFFTETSLYDKYKGYNTNCFIYYFGSLMLAFVVFFLFFIWIYCSRRGAGKRNCNLVSKILKVICALIILLIVPAIIWETRQNWEYARPFVTILSSVVGFFVTEHFVFRWTVVLGLISNIFFETYYYYLHNFKINCIARGMCLGDEADIRSYLLLYGRALFVVFLEFLSIYLLVYLLIALGFCSDKREYLVRDLDDYDVRRPQKLSIYDFIRTQRPYYMSLVENADPKERKRRKKERKEMKKKKKNEEKKSKKQNHNALMEEEDADYKLKEE